MTIKFIPALKEISNFKVAPTQGESTLLNHLEKVFTSPPFSNRNFEVYFQPNLFFGKPDVIIIEPSYGLWIIEVKDYDYNAYVINDLYTPWRLAKDHTVIESPFLQIKQYKQKLIEFSGPEVYNSNQKSSGILISLDQ